jgi:hypothetical protein
MSTYSLGLVVIRLIAEGEAKAGNFDAIYPEHLWMALTKISDLANEVIADIINVAPDDKAALIAETEHLRTWFAAQQMDTIRLRRKLRSLLGRGNGTPEQLHRSSDSRWRRS